ncbi:hypothetical protein [Nodosilinea nodulosa]|uniref:hypothetical protein n=1 Tax=Nodosilinea nodulosa TaxID=416001 RepID=UPI0012D73E01|nr:hypothetical protein [Nodosilinea nodulosa]
MGRLYGQLPDGTWTGVRVDANGAFQQPSSSTPFIGTPVELLNANTGGANNNRTFTVPANKIWQVQAFRLSYVSSATAGNRGLRLTYETSSGVVLCSQRSGVSQAASQTREYAFAAGAPYESAFGGVNSDYLLVPLPPLFLKAGQIIRFRDPANISTSDSFTVNGTAIEWSI